jgi:zinc transport system substrate-binding protein
MVEAGAPRATICDMGEPLGFREEASHDEGGEHDHGESDPHWWLSPVLTARAVPALADAFSRVDPAGERGYRSRASALVTDLSALDAEITRTLSPHRGRGFGAAHAAWGHFAARYGLRMTGVIEPAPGRDPLPNELRMLVDAARRDGYRVLFTEPQFPLSAARTVASDAGLGLALVDPVGGVPGRAGYFEMMRFNADAFARGLGGGA